MKTSDFFPARILRRVFRGLAAPIGLGWAPVWAPTRRRRQHSTPAGPEFPKRRHPKYRARGLGAGVYAPSRSDRSTRPPARPPGDGPDRCEAAIPMPAWPSGPRAGLAGPRGPPRRAGGEADRRRRGGGHAGAERVSAIKSLLMAGRLNIEAIRTAQACRLRGRAGAAAGAAKEAGPWRTGRR